MSTGCCTLSGWDAKARMGPWRPRNLWVEGCCSTQERGPYLRPLTATVWRMWWGWMWDWLRSWRFETNCIAKCEGLCWHNLDQKGISHHRACPLSLWYSPPLPLWGTQVALWKAEFLQLPGQSQEQGGSQEHDPQFTNRPRALASCCTFLYNLCS